MSFMSLQRQGVRKGLCGTSGHAKEPGHLNRTAGAACDAPDPAHRGPEWEVELSRLESALGAHCPPQAM